MGTCRNCNDECWCEAVSELDEAKQKIGQQKLLLENMQERIDQLHTRVQSEIGMADCMRMSHQELIDAGVIGKGIAPMFVVDAVLKHVKTLQDESEESDQLRTRLSFILRGVAVALKGPEEPLTSHSWHDLAELAALTALEAKRFDACRIQAREIKEDGGEEAFVTAVDEYRQEHGL